MSDAAITTGDPGLLFSEHDWSYDAVQRTYDAIEEIALKELGLDVYPNQIEVITAEQMLDAYASIGMPLMYNHWSFGKHFAYNELLYRKGARGLAYEIVINSNPCISYVMEDNSMAMQALVIAHAAFGHNHFFKNNNLFRQWTDAEAILDYMQFAKSYIARCEERHGARAVERVLDAAHALMDHGVNRYQRKRRVSPKSREQRARDRLRYEEESYNDLWQRTVPVDARPEHDDGREPAPRVADLVPLPEENILYYLEKMAPRLEPWKREILRIVRQLAQYFYPQKQTKVMNEGCATYVHYRIMNRLHEKGLLSDGGVLEFLHSHSSVIFQPDFDDKRYSGINPYALGFEMMTDIQRICERPTDEDREWFPEIAGNGDAMGTLRDAWANYRDESFVLQFLSPAVMRRFKMFRLSAEADDPEYLVEAIHNERGYQKIRKALARRYDVALQDPNIQVIAADLDGDRVLVLRHEAIAGRLLDREDATAVLQHVADLWGYPVALEEVDAASHDLLREHDRVEPRP
ncbi:MAG: SpoVR family protein [Thalassobaculum sp.]|uniref:SpoVR family protein n=1 Tax=Thalassobaculum sp. TaxID=2022740 RepID=UPI0032ED54F4